eukprot:TRINITY_DN15967_c0_g1_i1.p2 TRINITY_DN15967_c0_g1~~TRINITY_DN15967_c0_g1_i1.p2  ORF type:complete len:102 (-),score=10.87 TRINITY_DN15967_c0_g1_i1:7-312(-)
MGHISPKRGLPSDMRHQSQKTVKKLYMKSPDRDTKMQAEVTKKKPTNLNAVVFHIRNWSSRVTHNSSYNMRHKDISLSRISKNFTIALGSKEYGGGEDLAK